MELSLNHFSLLKYFRATCFGPLPQLSIIYKQQNISTFFANLHGDMNPLLIVL
jgi:hypothetical protein